MALSRRSIESRRHVDAHTVCTERQYYACLLLQFAKLRQQSAETLILKRRSLIFLKKGRATLGGGTTVRTASSRVLAFAVDVVATASDVRSTHLGDKAPGPSSDSSPAASRGRDARAPTAASAAISHGPSVGTGSRSCPRYWRIRRWGRRRAAATPRRTGDSPYASTGRRGSRTPRCSSFDFDRRCIAPLRKRRRRSFVGARGTFARGSRARGTARPLPARPSRLAV